MDEKRCSSFAGAKANEPLRSSGGISRGGRRDHVSIKKDNSDGTSSFSEGEIPGIGNLSRLPGEEAFF